MRGTLLIALVLALAAPAPPVRAADKTARVDRVRVKQARQAFELGKKAYTVGDFDHAIELWKEGYELKDDPIFLYNIAQAYRQKGDSAKAIFYYRGYLRDAPQAKNRPEVEARMAELQRGIDEAERAAQAAPPPPPPAPPPPAAQEVAPAASPVASDEQPKPGKAMRVAGIVTVGVGVAALGAATFFGLRARSLANELEDATGSGQPWSQDLADKESRGKTMNILSLVGCGVGAAAVVTGGILYYLGARKDAQERTAFLPAIGPDGAQVNLRVMF
jgi:tetratricopeptide (TPR) repeat protein